MDYYINISVRILICYPHVDCRKNNKTEKCKKIYFISIFNILKQKRSGEKSRVESLTPKEGLICGLAAMLHKCINL